MGALSSPLDASPSIALPPKRRYTAAMLDLMRRHSRGWLVYLIFGAIIFVFAVSFGPGSGSFSAGAGVAAVVEGQKIQQQEFALLYSQRVESMRRAYQKANIPFTSDMIERMGLPQQVLDSLIEARLLAVDAKSHGLSVSDSDLLNHLKESYGVDQVSAEQYKSWVTRTFRLSVEKFEERVRDEVLSIRFKDILTSQVGISDAELKTQFKRDHDRVMAWLVKFDPETMTVPEPTSAQISEFIQNSPDKLKEGYEEEKFRYGTPQRNSARQILRKLDPGADEAAVQREKDFLIGLKKQIEAGADFAALVQEHSQDDGTKAKGGDLGSIAQGRGLVASELEEVIFTLGVNAVSEPVKTRQGVHLIQVTAVEPAATKELDEVKEELAARMLRDLEGERIAKDSAEALLAQMRAGKDLEQLTILELPDSEEESQKPVRMETPWILRDQKAIPRVGSSDELHDGLFSLTQEAPIAPQAYRVGRSFYVALLKEREMPDMEKFEQEKEQLREQALATRRSRVYRDWLSHRREKASIEISENLIPQG